MKTVVKVNLPKPVKGVYTCNLLEQERENLPWTEGPLELVLKPFEIVTIGLEV